MITIRYKIWDESHSEWISNDWPQEKKTDGWWKTLKQTKKWRPAIKKMLKLISISLGKKFIFGKWSIVLILVPLWKAIDAASRRHSFRRRRRRAGVANVGNQRHHGGSLRSRRQRRCRRRSLGFSSFRFDFRFLKLRWIWVGRRFVGTLKKKQTVALKYWSIVSSKHLAL